MGVHTCNTEQKWFRWKKMEELKLKVFREKQSREFKCMNISKIEVIFCYNIKCKITVFSLLCFYRSSKCLELIPKALTNVQRTGTICPQKSTFWGII